MFAGGITGAPSANTLRTLMKQMLRTDQANS